MKAKIIFFLVLLSLQSCNIINPECDSCFTPPDIFIIDLVDANGENVFTANLINPEEIELIDLATNEAVEYTFISENGLNYIEIASIGWKTETVECAFINGQNTLFTLYVNAVRKTENCCSFTEYNEIRFEGAEAERNTSTGVYTVSIE